MIMLKIADQRMSDFCVVLTVILSVLQLKQEPSGHLTSASNV